MKAMSSLRSSFKKLSLRKQLPPGPPGIAATLPADILSSILDHFSIEDRQTVRHVLSLVSRHWRAATHDPSSFVVTTPAKASALARRISEDQFEGRETHVRKLYLTCSFPGGFTETHTRAFVDLLEECSDTLRELDLAVGPRRKPTWSEWRGEGQIPVDPLGEFSPEGAYSGSRMLSSGDGPVGVANKSLGGLGGAIAQLSSLRILRINNDVRPVHLWDLMAALEPVSHLEVLDISRVELRRSGGVKFTQTSWTSPFNRLRQLSLDRLEGDNDALVLATWLFLHSPKHTNSSQRSLAFGKFYYSRDISALAAFVLPIRHLVVELQCTVMGPDGDDATSYRLLNSLLTTLPHLTSLHISLAHPGPGPTPAYDAAAVNRTIFDTLADVRSLQHLTLRFFGTPDVVDFVEYLRRGKVRRVVLEWAWYEGPGVEAFEAMRKGARESGVELRARRVPSR